MYNKVIMVGNLTRDIELRYLPSGSALAKAAIATSYKFKDQAGQPKEEVCFLDFSIFGRKGEVANQYLKKGSKVLLEGRLVFEQWTAQDGSTRSRHTLNVDEMKLLDPREATSPHAAANAAMAAAPAGEYEPAQAQEAATPAPKPAATPAPKPAATPAIDLNDPAVQAAIAAMAAANANAQATVNAPAPAPKAAANTYPAPKTTPVIDIDEDEIPF